MNATMQERAAEDATGCNANPHGLGKLYADGGEVVSVTKAKRLFRDGKSIEIPNAGAGSYNKVLAMLGYKRVEVVDWTSSAGDWTLAIRTADGWKPVSQENRHPYHGFRYALCSTPWPMETFEELCSYLSE